MDVCMYLSDVQQHMVGSCDLTDIAVKVATRVIGHYPHRNQLVVDAGWMALSLDGQGKLPTGSYCIFPDHPDLRYHSRQSALFDTARMAELSMRRSAASLSH